MLLWAPLASGAYRGWPLAITQLLALLGVLAWLLRMTAGRRLEWRRTALDLPLALLVALVLLQIAIGNGPLASWALAPARSALELPAELPAPIFWLGTVSPVRTLRSLLLLATYAAVYVLVVNLVTDRRQLDRLVRALLLVGAGLAFFGLIDYMLGEAWLLQWSEGSGRGRLTGTFVNPDHFATWLGMLACLGLGYLMARRRPRSDREETVRRYLPFIGVAILALALVFTLSRGALLSLLATLALLLVAMSVLGRTRWSVTVIGALLAFTLAYGAWIGLTPLLVRLHADAYLSRAVLFVTTLPMLADFPVLGVGLGAYRDIYFRYQPSALDAGRVYYPYAHNDLLQLAVEVGLVGAAIVLFLAWRLARDLFAVHVLGRGRCPAGGGEGEGAHRRDPFSVGLALGALGAVLTLTLHSVFDFSARIPANGVLAAACLGIATVALHTRFGPEPRLLTAVGTLPLGGWLAPLVGALALAGALAAVPLIVSPALVEIGLGALAGPDALREVDGALAIDRRDERALSARARLRFDAATRLAGADARARQLLEGAVEDLRGAIARTPTDPFLHERLAWSYAALAEVDSPRGAPLTAAAVSHLRRAIALAPENPFLHRALAALATTQPAALWRIGLPAAREAVRRDPEMLPDLVGRFLPLGLGEADWLAFVPDSALDRLALASLLETWAHAPEAAAVYRGAVAAARGDEEPLARWMLAAFLTRTGEAEAALRELDQALGRDPDNPELHLARGDVLAARGDATALDAYRAGVAAALTVTSKPGHATLPFRLETPRARALIAERLGAGEQLTVTRYRRALARHLSDRHLWEQAAAEWKSVLAARPNDAGAHFALGVALDGVAATDEAIEAYRRAVALDGRSARYRLRLAQRLWDTEQYHQAMNEWRAVTAQEPANLEAGLALARAFLQIGDRVAAFREYQRLLRIAPDNSEAQRGLASLRGRS